jgi:hypothetical protein
MARAMPDDDATALARLRQLLDQQEALAADPATRRPGAPEAATAVVEALAAEANRLLLDRQRAGRELQARVEAGALTPAQYMVELGKLWGAEPGATPKQIVDAMISWVRRSTPDAAASERVFAEALKKLKGSDPP